MREVIWALVGVLFAYAVYQIARAVRVGRAGRRAAVDAARGARSEPGAGGPGDEREELYVFGPSPFDAGATGQPPSQHVTVHAGEREGGGEIDTRDLPLFTPGYDGGNGAGQQAGPQAVPRAVQSAVPQADVPRFGGAGGEDAGGQGGFQLELEVRQLRRDIAQLREELDTQRARCDRLETEHRTVREHLEATLASQGISPEYNEALVFARRGMDVDAIAERCGISVAEAELVHALARGGQPDRGDT